MTLSNWIYLLYKILQKLTKSWTFRNINLHILDPSLSSLIQRELQYSYHWEHPFQKAQWYQHQLPKNAISSSLDDFCNTLLVNYLESYQNHRQVFGPKYSNASISEQPHYFYLLFCYMCLFSILFWQFYIFWSLDLFLYPSLFSIFCYF